MAITFSCPRCGARFDIDERFAGKRGRCRKCGHMMEIPEVARAAPAGATTSMFRLSRPESPSRLAPAPQTLGAATGPNAAPMFPSQAELAPLSASEIRPISRANRDGAGRGKPSFNPALLEESTSGNYALIPTHEALPKLRNPYGGGKPLNPVAQFWRNRVNSVLKVLRKVGDFAYLLSVPFIMAVLLGIVLRNRQIALFGATVVIVLNVGRLLLYGSYLILLPYRESPIQGLLCLFPPYTVYYVATHWNRMKRATLRFLGPALLIAAVLIPFAIFPSLSSGRVEAGASLEERVKTELGDVKAEMKGTLGVQGGAGASLKEQLNQLEQSETAQEARQKVGSLVDRAREGIRSAEPGASPPVESSPPNNP